MIIGDPMKKGRILLFIILFFLGFYFSFKTIEEKSIHNNEQIIEYVIHNSFENKTLVEQILPTVEWKKSIYLLKEDYKTSIKEEKVEDISPTIYLYNSHPTEEYTPETIGEYSLNPTVIMNNYILEDILNKNGYKAYVEEESVKDILNKNNWNYASSYKASRLLLEKRKHEYPTLKYFIDIHRDSISKDKTTIEIEGRSYAKLLFIIGLENNHYQDNLLFTEKIVEKINNKYPNLCKGIYKKEGQGVNGVYNQDFSPYTILIEVGGYENTTVEVLNSSIAFANSFLEVLHEEAD